MHKNLRRALCVATAAACGIAIAPRSNADTLTSFDYRSTASWSDVTDSHGNVWQARAGLAGGRGTSNNLLHKDVAGTSDPALYRVNTFGAMQYHIPVPGTATYKVTLHMAEDFFHRSGARVFNVSAEGTPELSNVDIFADAGFATADQRSFTVPVTDGTLDLSMDAVKDNPLISAVEVTYAGPADSTPVNAPLQPAPQVSGDHAVNFSPNSFWFQDVSKAPVADNSQTLTDSLASQVANWYGGIAAFNAYKYNVALYKAAAGQATTDVTWVDCQNKGSLPENIYTGKAYFKNVPIPDNAKPANGNDGELTVYDPTNDKLWDFWEAKKTDSGWQACWGGRIDNVSQGQGQFQNGYGASATNLAIAGGMISLDDVRRGYINHTMSLVIMNPAPFTQVSWPGQRSDGAMDGGGVIREGQRLRLDPSLDLSKYSLTPMARMIAVAAQKYGFVVSDKGGAVSVSTESGADHPDANGANPWDAILAGTPDYQVMRNFPWDKTQFLPVDYGKP